MITNRLFKDVIISDKCVQKVSERILITKCFKPNPVFIINLWGETHRVFVCFKLGTEFMCCCSGLLFSIYISIPRFTVVVIIISRYPSFRRRFTYS